MGKLIIDGNSVYEVDEECMKRKHPSGIPLYEQNCTIEGQVLSGYPSMSTKLHNNKEKIQDSGEEPEEEKNTC